MNEEEEDQKSKLSIEERLSKIKSIPSDQQNTQKSQKNESLENIYEQSDQIDDQLNSNINSSNSLSQFNPTLINPNEPVSKEKFSSFLKEANKTFKRYEREISIYKKKLMSFDIKELKTSNQEVEITLNPSKKQMFFQYINKKLNEEDISIEEITKVYNEKMIDLFSENERLSLIVNKMSVEVVDKMTEQIQKLSIQVDNEKKEKLILKRKLDNLDSTFVQIDTLKEELNEKEEEITDLNKQEIKNVSKIEELSSEIKNYKEEIKKNKEVLNEKEKIISNHLENIQFLNKEINSKNEVIENKDKLIKEKDENINTLYNDNVQWEEKYELQSKEMDNFKKWSLWDQDLIESYKKIDSLQLENEKNSKELNELKEENTKLNNIKKQLSDTLLSNKSIYEKTLKNLTDEHKKIVTDLHEKMRIVADTLNKKCQKLQDENENLYSIKLLYDKSLVQLEDYNQITQENIKLKKDLNKTVFEYEDKINKIKNGFEENVTKLTMKYETELQEQKENYESTISDNNKTYKKDNKEHKKIIEEKDNTIKTLNETIEQNNNDLKKKEDMLNNVKELYNKLLIKIENQNKQIVELQKNSFSVNSNIPNTDDTGINIAIDANNNAPLTKESTGDLTKYKFTSEILRNYLYLLHLYENSYSFNMLIIELQNNVNMYNKIIFKSCGNINNSLNCLQSEFLEDLYFTCFDVLMSKKLTVDNSNNKLKNNYQLSFEDYDKDTIKEIIDILIQKNIISRLRNPTSTDQLYAKFIKNYNDRFDFGTISFKDYLKENILPHVLKQIEKDNKNLYENLTTLTEICLHNLKNGRIIINEKQLYNFEYYYEMYFNYADFNNRNNSLIIKKKILNYQYLDNIIHNIKYYIPSEIYIHKLIDMNNIKDPLSINYISKLFSSLLVYSSNKLLTFEFAQSNLTENIFNTLVLPTIKHLNKITTLNLYENNLEDNGIVQLMEYLETNKSIKSLSIASNNLTSKSGFALAKLIKKNNTIESLDISKNEINDNGLTSLFTELSSNKSIKIFNIAKNDLQVEDYKNLCEFLMLNPSLTQLDISDNFIDPSSAGAIGVSITHAMNLKVFKVNKSSMKDETCANLLNNFTSTNIEHLELDWHKFGENGPMVTLSKIKGCKNLKYLSLQQCDFSNRNIIDCVAENLKNSFLKTVNLEWNSFDVDNFKKFYNNVCSNKSICFKFSKNMVPKNAKEITGNSKNFEFI